MKCKCGSEIELKIAAKVKGDGCRILSALTTIVTIQCEECGAIMQVPISSKHIVVKDENRYN